jgi:hypothetical protein
MEKAKTRGNTHDEVLKLMVQILSSLRSLFTIGNHD